ncbi:MAG: hypothetical protein ACLQJR_26165 [Stellaceae bacterium]
MVKLSRRFGGTCDCPAQGGRGFFSTRCSLTAGNLICPALTRLSLAVALGTALWLGGARPSPAAAATIDYDAVEISDLFRDFAASVAQHDGERAATMVSDDCILFFERVRVLALTADFDVLDAMWRNDKLFANGKPIEGEEMAYAVFLVRRYFAPKEIEEHDGRWLLGAWIDRGFLIPNAWATRLHIEPVDDPRSRELPGAYLARLAETQDPVAFVKEHGEWRLHAMTLFIFEWASAGARRWLEPLSPEDDILLADIQNRTKYPNWCGLCLGCLYDTARLPGRVSGPADRDTIEQCLAVLFGGPVPSTVFAAMDSGAAR